MQPTPKKNNLGQLPNALTTVRCQKILANILAARPWTVTKVARVVGNTSEYVRRIQTGAQSFQVSDVELLAAACGKKSYELIFESIDVPPLSSPERRLYEMGVEQIRLHKDFGKLLAAKPKRRSRTSAA